MRIFLAVACMAAASWVASAGAQNIDEAPEAPLVLACGSGADHGGGTTSGGSDTSGASRGAARNAGDAEFESGAGPDGRMGTADDEDVAGDAPSRYGVGPDGIPGTADDEEHAPGKIPGTDGDPNSGRELDSDTDGLDGGMP